MTALENFMKTCIKQNVLKPNGKHKAGIRQTSNYGISQAIKSINSGKAPGPDGFPIEFYRTFQDKLITPLLNMYEEAYQNEALPPTLR